jgi:hypothetical protein
MLRGLSQFPGGPAGSPTQRMVSQTADPMLASRTGSFYLRLVQTTQRQLLVRLAKTRRSLRVARGNS